MGQGEAILRVEAVVVVVVAVHVVVFVVVSVVDGVILVVIVFIVTVHVVTIIVIFVIAVPVAATIIVVGVPVVTVHLTTNIIIVVVVFLVSAVNRRIAVATVSVVIVVIVVEGAVISTIALAVKVFVVSAEDVKTVSVSVPGVVLIAVPPPPFGAKVSSFASGAVVVWVVAIVHSSVVPHGPVADPVLPLPDRRSVLFPSLAFVQERILPGIAIVPLRTSRYSVAPAPRFLQAVSLSGEAAATVVLSLAVLLLFFRLFFRGVGETVAGD